MTSNFQLSGWKSRLERQTYVLHMSGFSGDMWMQGPLFCVSNIPILMKNIYISDNKYIFLQKYFMDKTDYELFLI